MTDIHFQQNVPHMFEEGTLYTPLNRMLLQAGFQYEITCTANEGHMDLFLKLYKAIIKKGDAKYLKK